MPVTEERFDDEIDVDDPVDVIEPDNEEGFFTEEDSDEGVSEKRPPSVWQKIRRFFYQTRAEQEADQQRRLTLLNQTIETYPMAAVNYLLRGELLLDMKLREAAKDDLEKALDLAEEQLQADRWGVSTQAIRDRARRGLHRLG